MNIYQVLKRPILTEKTDYQRDENQYVFEVDRRGQQASDQRGGGDDL